jgi:hypothetical protein
MSETLKDVVREKYGEAAKRAIRGEKSSCCGSSADSSGCCGTSDSSCGDPITSNLYNEAEKGSLPETAVRASLGCGNPTALAELRPGETVLDLGSGGGIDVLPLRSPRGPDRQGLWPGHDGRDAGARAQESKRCGLDQR